MRNVVALFPDDSRRNLWANRLGGAAAPRWCTTWAELDATVRRGGADLVMAACENGGAQEAAFALTSLRDAHPGLPLAVVHGGTTSELDALGGRAAERLGLEYLGTDGGVLPLLLNPPGPPGLPARPSAGELLVTEAELWARGRASRAIALHAALSPSGRWTLGAVARTCGVALRTAQNQFQSAGLTAKLIWETCLAFHGACRLETVPGRTAEVATALGMPPKRLRQLIRRAFGQRLSELVAVPGPHRLTLLRAGLRKAARAGRNYSPAVLRRLRPSDVRFRVPANVGVLLAEKRARISDRRRGARHLLTGIAAQVWPLVLQGASVAEITGWIAMRHRLTRPAAYDAVNAAIARFIELELVEPDVG